MWHHTLSTWHDQKHCIQVSQRRKVMLSSTHKLNLNWRILIAVFLMVVLCFILKRILFLFTTFWSYPDENPVLDRIRLEVSLAPPATFKVKSRAAWFVNLSITLLHNLHWYTWQHGCTCHAVSFWFGDVLDGVQMSAAAVVVSAKSMIVHNSSAAKALTRGSFPPIFPPASNKA